MDVTDVLEQRRVAAMQTDSLAHRCPVDWPWSSKAERFQELEIFRIFCLRAVPPQRLTEKSQSRPHTGLREISRIVKRHAGARDVFRGDGMHQPHQQPAMALTGQPVNIRFWR